MTNMDDQVAKHIRELLLRTTRKASDDPERSRESEALNRVVRVLRGGSDFSWELMPPSTRYLWWDDGSKT